MNNQGSPSDTRKGFFFFIKAPRPALRPILPPIQWTQRDFSPGIKRPWLEADHSPLQSPVSRWRRVYLSTATILPLFVFLSQTHTYVHNTHTHTHNGAEWFSGFGVGVLTFVKTVMYRNYWPVEYLASSRGRHCTSEMVALNMRDQDPTTR